MQDNFYFLYPLTQHLANKLCPSQWTLGYKTVTNVSEHNATLLTCFSQSKDELILGFALEPDHDDFYIRANLTKDFNCLSFPMEFQRARRNSVDLFKDILDLKVLKITQMLNERSFALHFEKDYVLLFKMHGRRSNVILFQNEEFIIGFHKKMIQDQNIQLPLLDRPITQDYENFKKTDGDYKLIYPTFGDEMRAYLNAKSWEAQPLETKWEIIQQLLKELGEYNFYLIYRTTDPQLSLLKPDHDDYYQFKDPLQASNEFYYAYLTVHSLRLEKNEAVRSIQKKAKQTLHYIQNQALRLTHLQAENDLEKTADVIMANLHQIPTGIEKIELFDFYKNETRWIKLKKELSPQKNAENYYRKSKNEKIEIEKIAENILTKKKELAHWNLLLEEVENINQIKALRKFSVQNKLTKKIAQKGPEEHMFKKFQYQGFDIWIGKNAKNNDLLTLHYSFKEDLWLHAKDVSGSHVLIKYQSGKPFTKEVIQKAATLAAYYSKRSNDSLCPVIFTPKKFVRKTKDLAPGQVIVEKEEVILVIPEKF